MEEAREDLVSRSGVRPAGPPLPAGSDGASILGAFEDLPEGLSDEELRGMGVNRAHVHTDLMIGSDEVEVDGL